MKNSIKKTVLQVTFFLIAFSFFTNVQAQTKRNTKQEEANKKLVSSFYQSLFGDKDLSVIDQYLVKDYIQHNPAVADGSEALKEGLKIWFAGAPKEKINIQHIAADGDLVFIHLKSKGGDGKTISVIDIFKLKNNKIVEHWDVIQEVPATSANPHPMF
jgi:predicted SnoaL-like aldol condensation-catalyzing enzyme